MSNRGLLIIIAILLVGIFSIVLIQESENISSEQYSELTQNITSE